MNSFAQLAQDAFALGLQGREVDLVVRSAAPNARDADPFIAVPLENVDRLRTMLPDAADRYLYIEAGRFYFSASYGPEERCPWPRVYAFRAGEDLFAAASVAHGLEADGYGLRPLSPAAMRDMLPAEAHVTRVADYRRRLGEEVRSYDGLYKGRKQARIAAEGILLNSGEQCLSCDAPRERLVTSTLGGPDGLMVGFHLCQRCGTESQRYPFLLAYLSARFGGPVPHSVVVATREEAYERGRRVLRDDLGCEIEKEVPRQLQVTGRRPSGFRVIFRLEGPLNYGYTFLDPDGRQVGRFDSSKDHPTLPYGPDHFHYDLPADNSKVRSSFLTGVPELDVLALRDFLVQVEPRLDASP